MRIPLSKGRGVLACTNRNGEDDLNSAELAARSRWIYFFGWVLVFGLFFSNTLVALARVCFANDDVSYCVLIPFISAFILFLESDKVNSLLAFEPGVGSGLLLLAAVTTISTRFAGIALSEDWRLSGYLLSLALFWMAGFSLLFGTSAFKASCFPLLFLLLMIPPPNSFLARFIYSLQVGSASIAGALFDLLGVPVLREGFVFHLARFNIEVAKECSGIRSSMALLILALVFVHFGLHKPWKRAVFLVCGLIVMILKNGIRIVTLALLAMHVDPGFLYGRLHHRGGVVFFLIGLLLLAPVYWLLLQGEGRESPLSESLRDKPQFSVLGS